MSMNEQSPHSSYPDTVSVPEAARLLGVARKTVYDLIEWGELGAVRIGSAVRIDREDIERFRASGKIP